MTTNIGIARGTLTQAAFDANTDYLLKNWRSLASGASFQFTAETQFMIDFYTRKTRAYSGITRGSGYSTISPWLMTMDSDMSVYLESTIFQGEPSTAVTIKTYDVYRKAYYYFNCIATYEMLTESITNYSNRVMTGYRMMFNNAVIAS